MINQITTYTSNVLYSAYSYTLQPCFNAINYIDKAISSIPIHISNYFNTCPVLPQKEASIIKHFEYMNKATCDINNSPDLTCPAPVGFIYTPPSIKFGDVIVALIGAAETSKCLSAELGSMEHYFYCD